MNHPQLPTALALAFVAAVGCGAHPSPGAGKSSGVAEGTFRVTVQNGQAGNTALRIQGGRVFTADLRIDCGVDASGKRLDACTAELAAGTMVVLHATASGSDASFTPARPFAFLGWAGDCSGERDCTLSGKADRYVLAVFGTERTGHPNYTSPAVHGPAWAAYAAGTPGALDCRGCHGANLQGQGIAVSCSSCHAWPPSTPGAALSWDQAAWDQARWQ